MQKTTKVTDETLTSELDRNTETRLREQNRNTKENQQNYNQQKLSKGLRHENQEQKTIKPEQKSFLKNKNKNPQNSEAWTRGQGSWQFSFQTLCCVFSETLQHILIAKFSS